MHDLDEEALNAFVAEGVPGGTMPGFGRTLSKDQIGDVTAFIGAWKTERITR